ncbi:MAG: HD domain-containing protein [Saprospiraceae bacterium]
MKFIEAQAFILELMGSKFPKGLDYHSVEHVLDVTNAAGEIAKAENVSGEDLVLLITAALYHDCGFIDSYANHEDFSCNLARKHLPAFEYSESQIEQICDMIQATRVPQKPHNLLASILVDADMDYLGRTDFFPIANHLYLEWKYFGMIETVHEWNKIQLKFLESHRFFTESSQQRRSAQKAENLAMIRQNLAK